ncbi:GSCOCG00012115001-RA-CDS [Cotesia congregata]|nr:GSCOCG00012115001-RA-CDS [Cotesia congregata]
MCPLIDPSAYSRLFEKLLLKRIKVTASEEELIPNHQFGFRNKHSTIEQVNRVFNNISNALEEKKYCSAAFLDIQQAFDEVWHTGLLYKIKKDLLQYYLLLKSKLSNRKFYVQHGQAKSTFHLVQAGVLQGSVLGPFLYTLFTADLPVDEQTTTAIFADDTAIIAADTDPTTASELLQNGLRLVQSWMENWRLKASPTKSVQITFTTRRGDCPPVTPYCEPLPATNEVKYLGLHLDRRLTWAKHIKTKRKEMELKTRLYWLLGKKSKLSLNNKLNIYKIILKPIWTYGIQLWGTASNSNLEILQRFQNKTIRNIVNAPWYVSNAIISRDLSIPTIKEEIMRLSVKYEGRLENHPNPIATELLNKETTRRLKGFKTIDLKNRFQ